MKHPRGGPLGIDDRDGGGDRQRLLGFVIASNFDIQSLIAMKVMQSGDRSFKGGITIEGQHI